MLTVLFWLALFSRWRIRVLRWALVGVLGFACAFGGVVFISFAQRIEETRVAFTESMMEKTGAALIAYRDAARVLPDCPWECMTAELEKYRLWDGDVRYDDHGLPAAEYVPHIPRRDRWGCRFAYERGDDGSFALLSSGPDRRYGTDDDLRFAAGPPA